MKLVILLISLAWSFYGLATCHDFSGKYQLRGTVLQLEVKQEACQSLQFIYSSHEEFFILDGEPRMIHQDDYITTNVAAFIVEAGRSILLKWENIFTDGSQNKDVWIKRESRNGKKMLIRGEGKRRSDGMWIWNNVHFWEHI